MNSLVPFVVDDKVFAVSAKDFSLDEGTSRDKPTKCSSRLNFYPGPKMILVTPNVSKCVHTVSP